VIAKGVCSTNCLFVEPSPFKGEGWERVMFPGAPVET
jgi:hypothetical protein